MRRANLQTWVGRSWYGPPSSPLQIVPPMDDYLPESVLRLQITAMKLAEGSQTLSDWCAIPELITRWSFLSKSQAADCESPDKRIRLNSALQ